jgi:uncharacterized membrane protein YkoI
MKKRSTSSLLSLGIGLCVLFCLVGCDSSGSSDSSGETSAAPAENSITLEQAQQRALDAVGTGRVTDTGLEDDFGATWEVEITRPDGSEVDVYVAADGTVVRTVEQ